MAKLSDREILLIGDLLSGLPIPAITQNTGRTKKQVEAQIRIVYQKLGVSNRTELGAEYRRLVAGMHDFDPTP
jgi:DNA-binding NarL/FixJ family response regulator